MNKREREGDCENVAFPFAICSLEFIAAACQDLRILAAPASTLQLATATATSMATPSPSPDDR